MKKITIITATHKNYRMPEEDIYLPLHVGAAGKADLDIADVVRDDSGDNISAKNPNWCELTGLYWAWKNLDCDYLGLAHYRRHFTSGALSASIGDKLSSAVTLLGGKLLPSEKADKYAECKWQHIIGRAELENLLGANYILLPTPRNYWIETNYSQYAHAHHAIDLDMTRQIIEEKCPEYIRAFDDSMAKTKGHRFNMFIMKKAFADEYCEWLFDILFELEKRLDISDYSKNDSRVFGFVSERLLDVWLDTKRYAYKEIPYAFMEDEDWIKKGSAFLKRKLAGNK